MNNQDRSDGYVALRDAPEEQRQRYSELLMMIKHRITITKEDKLFLRTTIDRGRVIREQAAKEVMQRLFTE